MTQKMVHKTELYFTQSSRYWGTEQHFNCHLKQKHNVLLAARFELVAFVNKSNQTTITQVL